jgi:DNA-binding NtrC family response regulator
LAQYFLRKFSGRMCKAVSAISFEAMQMLRGYGWSGNVRELENVMERGVALASGDLLGVADLPATIRDAARSSGLPSRPPLKEVERQYILETVDACHGNYDEAARLLGIATTLWRKLKEYANENGKPPSELE